MFPSIAFAQSGPVYSLTCTDRATALAAYATSVRHKGALPPTGIADAVSTDTRWCVPARRADRSNLSAILPRAPGYELYYFEPQSGRTMYVIEFPAR